jgi:hypothetical protein
MLRSRGDWKWFISRLKNMGKADVIEGVIAEGVGLVAGAGVGAVPAAVGGVCYTSAGRGIGILLDSWVFGEAY